MFLDVQAKLDALYDLHEGAWGLYDLETQSGVGGFLDELDERLDRFGLSIEQLAEEVAITLEEREFDAEDRAKNKE